MAQKIIRTIGVLTSGGDAPGMNAAIRAVVRSGLGKGLKVRGIRKGYQGLLNEEIIDLSARDVSDTIQRGGTILQTARCEEMRTEEGQQMAAAICKKYGIDGLVVIGGDGSFAGPSIWTLPVQNIPSDLTPLSILRWKQSTRCVIPLLLTRDVLLSRLWEETQDIWRCGAVSQTVRRGS